MARVWFKAKQVGWGWYPSTWQGYAVIFFYVLLLALVFIRTEEVSRSARDTVYGVIPEWALITALLLVICWLTGERPDARHNR